MIGRTGQRETLTRGLQRTPQPVRNQAAKAFTLVEILIVVVILGVLAAIILPRFSNASELAREAVLADDLRMLRMQTAIFRGQHIGVAPGYPDCDTSNAPTEAAFIAHLTMASDQAGNTAAPGTAGYRYGPYISSMLVNPLNGKSTVQVIGDDEPFPAGGDNSHGYVYKPATLMLKADSPGMDEVGKSYWLY